jgi:DNA-binding NtrC family response regulator
VQHFLDKYSEDGRKGPFILTPAALDRLMDYDWPGNVRELENVIERAVVLCPDREIGPDLIPDHVSADPQPPAPEVVIPADGIPFREIIIGHERRYIEAALDAAGGVQKRAAELLHIKATTLNEMMKRYEIRPRRRKDGEAESPETEAADRS